MTNLLCFLVEGNNDPEDNEIYFAKSSIEAKRWWADEHGDGPKYIAGISAKRQPQWDHHAPGPVPRLDLVDDGWWVECTGCYVRISEEDIGERIGYDDDDWDMVREYGPDISRPIMRPVEHRIGAAYCCQQCYDEDMSERRRIKRMKAAAIRVATARLTAQHPGVTALNRPGQNDRHVYVTRDWRTGRLLIHDVRVDCTFPGMTHNASIHMSDEKWRHARTPDYAPQRKSNSLPMSEREREWSFWVARGDFDAWRAFQAATAKPSNLASIPADHPLANATEF